MVATKPAAKRKPNCIKGTACGFACIAKGKQCSDKVLARDAASLEAAAKGKAKDKTKAAPAPKVGDGTVKPFTSVKILGEEALGITELTDRNTVVKTIGRYRAGNSYDLSSLEKEYAGLKVLGDLGIGPKPLGIDKQKGLIEMEFVTGTALVNLPEKFNTIGDQVADTLFKLHRAGYTHNDMHLGNVMVTDSGEIKIIDAGMLTKSGSTDRQYTNGVNDLTRMFQLDSPKRTAILEELSRNKTRDDFLLDLGTITDNYTGDERAKKLAGASATMHKAYLAALDKLGY